MILNKKHVKYNSNFRNIRYYGFNHKLNKVWNTIHICIDTHRNRDTQIHIGSHCSLGGRLVLTHCRTGWPGTHGNPLTSTPELLDYGHEPLYTCFMPQMASWRNSWFSVWLYVSRSWSTEWVLMSGNRSRCPVDMQLCVDSLQLFLHHFFPDCSVINDTIFVTTEARDTFSFISSVFIVIGYRWHQMK